MNRSTWKKYERDWAEWLGGKRVPVTGRHSGDVPDIEHDYLAIEVKVTKHPVSAQMGKAQEQAQKAGRATGRLPVVCWTRTGGQGGSPGEHFVTFDLETWLQIQAFLDNNGFGSHPLT